MLVKIVCVYLLAMNVITFFTYGIDKLKAKKDMWRVPEKVLILMAVFGGSIGAILGMKLFHHKTQKLKFKIGVPVILMIQLAIVVFVWLKMKGIV